LKNNILNKLVTFCYIMGAILVIVGILGFFINRQDLARLLIIFGAFFCLPFHFMYYRKETEKGGSINTIWFLRFIAILIMLGLLPIFISLM